MKKLTLYFCSIILILVIAIGCSSTNEPPPVVSDDADVYVAGTDITDVSIAKYWKNGVEVILSDGITPADAYAIRVANTDVHVVGSESKEVDNVFVNRLKYWKNGEPISYALDTLYVIALPPGGGKSIQRIFSETANAVFVNGNDVYISVSRQYKVLEAGITIIDDLYAGYLKNGVSVNLGYGSPTSITVSGNDVYVAGRKSGRAVYWKNGTEVFLTDGSIGDAVARSITVSGTDVYVAGYEYYPAETRNKVKYWKNGIETILTEGSNNEEATSIAVVGNDVYVAGYEYTVSGSTKSIAKYWKNGTEVNLTDGSSLAKAYSIFVDETNVYVAGSERIISGSKDFAKYWKNGDAVALNVLPKEAVVKSIVVVR
jgi:hypothetical protein